MDKLVSVIVPAYNVEKYLSQCLESICNQDYKELEILVVDDGSNDSSGRIADEYATKDSRIHVIHQENAGVSAARNAGLSAATGVYCAFVDGDDLMEEKAISTMVTKMEAMGAQWLNCQYKRFDEKGERLEDFKFVSGMFPLKTKEQKLHFLYKRILPYHVGYEVWNKLFVLEIIKKNGLRFDTGCRIGEDLAFNIQYLFFAEGCVCVEDACYRYFLRDNSAMRNTKSLEKTIEENLMMLQGLKRDLDRLKAVEGQEVFLRAFLNQMDNSYVRHSVKEVVGVLKSLPQGAFHYEQSCELLQRKDWMMNVYTDDIKNIRWRFHMYCKMKLGKGNLPLKCYFFLYNIYRILTGKGKFEELIL